MERNEALLDTAQAEARGIGRPEAEVIELARRRRFEEPQGTVAEQVGIRNARRRTSARRRYWRVPIPGEGASDLARPRIHRIDGHGADPSFRLGFRRHVVIIIEIPGALLGGEQIPLPYIVIVVAHYTSAENRLRRA
jgi:hypothetical protein